MIEKILRREYSLRLGQIAWIALCAEVLMLVIIMLAFVCGVYPDQAVFMLLILSSLINIAGAKNFHLLSTRYKHTTSAIMTVAGIIICIGYIQYCYM